MPYYFASNNQAMFDRSTSSIVGTTLGGTFDAAVVDSSILIPARPASGPVFSAAMPLIIGGPSLTTKVFGHFEFNANGTAVFTGGPIGQNFFLQIRNSTGVPIFRIANNSGTVGTTTLQCQYWDGTNFIQTGPVVTLNFNGQNQYDFEFLPGALGTFILRVNGSATPVFSISGMNAAVNNFAAVDIGNPASVTGYLSQGILADFDLRGAKLNSLRPTGNGFHTDGTGTFSDVNTVVTDDTTGIGLPVVGNQKSFTKGALTTSGMVIDTAFVNIKSGVSGGVVNNARAIIRRAAVTTPTAAYSPSPGLGLQQAMLPLALDPSTGLAWTVANYNASELGVEARA